MWEIGDKMAEGAVADDQHEVVVAGARLGMAVAHEPHAGRDDAREHRRGRACRSGPTPTCSWRRRRRRSSACRRSAWRHASTTELRGRESQPDEDKRGGGSDDIGDISWTRADGVAELPGELPGGTRSQLGERDSRWRRRSRTRARSPARVCRR